jgi:hypothetical protein
MNVQYVDRIWLHKKAWNCHRDCVPVVPLEDYETMRERAAQLERDLEVALTVANAKSGGAITLTRDAPSGGDVK